MIERSLPRFAYGALTLYGAAFLTASATRQIGNSVKGLVPLPSSPATPSWQRHQALPPARFRLFPFRSPLLRESLLLSSPRVTEMFQFTRFPLPALCVQAGVTPHDGCRVSPFGHPRIEARSTAPRGFSQSPTSFFGFRRQGIHRWLFVAWRTKMLVLALEFSRSAPTRPAQGRRNGRSGGAEASGARVSTSPGRPPPRRGRSLKTEERGPASATTGSGKARTAEAAAKREPMRRGRVASVRPRSWPAQRASYHSLERR